MDFPIIDLMDEDACYAQLISWLHPEGLACPRCHQADRMRIHRSYRAPCGITAAATVAGSSTPSPAPPYMASGDDPENWSSWCAVLPKACPPLNWRASWTATARSCSN